MSTLSRYQLKGFFISTTLITLILVSEVFIRDFLFNASLPIIHSLQQSLPEDLSKIIFVGAASLADPTLVIALFLVIMAFQINKYFLVKVGIYVCFVAFILATLKTLYASPRPYWVKPADESLADYKKGEEIHPFERYSEYGNPSGHAFFTIALYGYLFYFFTLQHKRNVRKTSDLDQPLNSQDRIELYGDDKNVSIPAEEAAGLQTQQSAPLSRKWYIFMNVVFFTGMVLVCLSRLYLGMHAINQVCLGLCLGTYIMYIFVTFIDRRLENFLKAVAKQELRNRPLIIWSLSVCYVLVSLVPIALYLQNSTRNVVTDSDTWNKWWKVVQKELPKSATPGNFAYIKCFLDAGTIGGFFGLLIGCLASDGSYTETAPRISTIPKLKLFYRVLVFFVTSGVIPGILWLIPVPTENYILQYFLKYNLGTFTAGFACMKFVPMAYHKLDLEMEGDFFRVRRQIVEEKVEKSLLTKSP